MGVGLLGTAVATALLVFMSVTLWLLKNELEGSQELVRTASFWRDYASLTRQQFTINELNSKVLPLLSRRHAQKITALHAWQQSIGGEEEEHLFGAKQVGADTVVPITWDGEVLAASGNSTDANVTYTLQSLLMPPIFDLI
jgi:hypothetical protein